MIAPIIIIIIIVFKINDKCNFYYYNSCCCYSKDGLFLATASQDKSVNIYKRREVDSVLVKVKTIQVI